MNRLTKRTIVIYSFIYTALIIFLLRPAEAMAYIGPGAGLSVLGSLLAVLGAVLIGLIGIILYPLRRLLAHLRNKTQKEGR